MPRILRRPGAADLMRNLSRNYWAVAEKDMLTNNIYRRYTNVFYTLKVSTLFLITHNLKY